MKNRDKYLIYEIPIKTIEQAKEYFRQMGCSSFHMSRESQDRYDEYKKLNISKDTETEWRKERFYEYYSSIVGDMGGDSLWSIHSSMYDLYENLKTDQELIKLLEVTRYIREKVTLDEKIMVVETINGRTIKQARNGLIYKAYDAGNISAAKEFVELSLYFSSYEEGKVRNKERNRKSIELCKEIKSELGL
jgi:hypothetical protein